MEPDVFNDSEYTATGLTENALNDESGYDVDNKIDIIMPLETEIDVKTNDIKISSFLKKPIESNFRGLKNQRIILLRGFIALSISAALISELMKKIQLADKKISSIPLPCLSDERSLADIGLIRAKQKLSKRFEDPVDGFVLKEPIKLRMKNFTENDEDANKIDGEAVLFKKFYIFRQGVEREGVYNCETGEAFLKLNRSDDDNNAFTQRCMIAKKLFRALKKSGETPNVVLKRTGIRLPQYYAQNENNDVGDEGANENNKRETEGKPQISILYPLAHGHSLEKVLDKNITLDERLYIARQIILALTHLHAGGVVTELLTQSNVFRTLSGDIGIIVNDIRVYNDPDIPLYRKFNGKHSGKQFQWSMDNDYNFIKQSQGNIKDLGILISSLIPELQNEQPFVNHENGNVIFKKNTVDVLQSDDEAFVEKMKRWGELVQLLQSSSANSVLKLPTIFTEFSDILGK